MATCFRCIQDLPVSKADNRSKGYRETERSRQAGAGQDEEPMVSAWHLLTDRSWAKGLIEGNDNE